MSTERKVEVTSVIEDELERSAVKLAAVGLTARFRGMVERPMTDGGSSSTVEAEIGIYESGDRLFDMLEFFVEKDGKPTASVAEIREWLQQEIEQMVEDYPLRKGWEELP